MAKFSKRHGHNLMEGPIKIREDAPEGLRDFVIQVVYDFKYKPSFLRRVICRVLRISPDRNNFTDYPYIESEVEALIKNCPWYYVYDIIEAFWVQIGEEFREEYSEELNDYFNYNGIGWKINSGLIELRGDKIFENSVSSTVSVLATVNLQTAKSEIAEAIHDLSRRPQADITGSIQHALACLECVCREVTGNKKATLGELIKKFPNIVPKPLDVAIEKIWGFSSEQGRHLTEGNQPEFHEAELVVGITASIAGYLGKKLGDQQNNNLESENEFPFE